LLFCFICQNVFSLQIFPHRAIIFGIN